MVLADRLSGFPSHKEKLPITLHQNIQHIHFLNNICNIIRVAAECDPIHNTLYHLTLNRWPNHKHQITRIAKQSWRYKRWAHHNRFTASKRNKSMHTSKATWHDPYRTTWKPPRHWWNATTSLINHILAWYRCWYSLLCQKVHHLYPTQSNTGNTTHILIDIPDDPRQDLTTDFFTFHHKEHLLICNTFSKYPFVFKASSKATEAIQTKSQQLI